MKIVYRDDAVVAPEALARLFDRAGLRRPTGELDRLQRMLDHADLTWSAWAGETLVGIGRALTDYSFCCYLSDLAVDPDYQGRGIGQELIRRVNESSGPEAQLILLAAPSAETYYPHIGLEQHPSAWILRRER